MPGFHVLRGWGQGCDWTHRRKHKQRETGNHKHPMKLGLGPDSTSLSQGPDCDTGQISWPCWSVITCNVGGGAAASTAENSLALTFPATLNFMSPEAGTSQVFMIPSGLSSLSGSPQSVFNVQFKCCLLWNPLWAHVVPSAWDVLPLACGQDH